MNSPRASFSADLFGVNGPIGTCCFAIENRDGGGGHEHFRFSSRTTRVSGQPVVQGQAASEPKSAMMKPRKQGNAERYFCQRSGPWRGGRSAARRSASVTLSPIHSLADRGLRSAKLSSPAP